jgi:hypothetical protein
MGASTSRTQRRIESGPRLQRQSTDEAKIPSEVVPTVTANAKPKLRNRRINLRPCGRRSSIQLASLPITDPPKLRRSAMRGPRTKRKKGKVGINWIKDLEEAWCFIFDVKMEN